MAIRDNVTKGGVVGASQTGMFAPLLPLTDLQKIHKKEGSVSKPKARKRASIKIQPTP